MRWKLSTLYEVSVIVNDGKMVTIRIEASTKNEAYIKAIKLLERKFKKLIVHDMCAGVYFPP